MLLEEANPVTLTGSDPYCFFLQVVSWASMPDVKHLYKKCSIQLIREVSGNNPFISPKWHTCRGKILLLCSRGKNGNRTACKWKVYFSIFRWQAFQFIISVVVAFGRQRKSRYKWKPRPLRLPWRLKARLSLFLLLFGLFSWSVNMHDYIHGKYDNQNNWCDHTRCFCRCNAEGPLYLFWKQFHP